ncbi:MAG: Crp/Fnr family transcriptional regulator [Clostridia bacterium]
MEEYFDILEESALFSDIAYTDFMMLLTCCGGRIRYCIKGEHIFDMGERCESIGIVLVGHARAVRNDFEGQRVIIKEYSTGQMLGEEFACAQSDALPFNIVVTEPSAVLLLDYARIMSPCQSACASHIKLINNIVQIIAAKYLRLAKRTRHLKNNTIRGKLLSYLLEISGYSREFTLPIGYDELAIYLCIEPRSLSVALRALRSEGILDYRKDYFCWIRKPLPEY